MNTDHQPSLPLPVFSREIRLGLVLYGGVSLAVYMNGVCQEFYNAIRGRGIYKLLKALTDSDIVVDIVSGTSAGGVNGVLLSYAIANSNLEEATNFQKFTELWREQGDIQKLLRKSWPKIKFFSFLDGEEFYQKRFEEAFQEPVFPSIEDWYSDFGELDLFITATDFNGKTNQTFDNVGKVIDVKDHKAFFHLKYRQDQSEYVENPFRIFPENTITQTALAKLCRATSCFPVAFPVVTVELSPEDHEKPDTDAIKVDRRLVEWGQLQDRDLEPNYRDNKRNYPIYLIDGGVLDNRPFTYTVEAIYGRTAYRRVERLLFYLDPTPDRFFGDVTQKERNIPPVDKVLIGALTGLPSYQSITKDLQLIEEGNRKVTRYKLLKETILQDIDNPVNKDRDLLKENAYIKCRLLGLLDRTIHSVLIRKSPFETKRDCNKDFLDKTAEILKDLRSLKDFRSLPMTEEEKEVPDLETIYRDIQPIDIGFLIRKYCFLLDRIAELSDRKMPHFSRSRSSHSADFPHNNVELRQFLALRYLSYQLSWQLELLKLIQKSLDRILNYYDFAELAGTEDVSKFDLEKIYRFLTTFHKTLLSVNYKLRPDVDEELSSGDLLTAYYEFFKKIHFPQEINFKNENVNWSNLKLLLPEQESSISKQIFEQIYQLPICKVLTLHSFKDKKREIDQIKLRTKQNISAASPPSKNDSWSEVNLWVLDNIEILEIDLSRVEDQDNWENTYTILQLIEKTSQDFIESLTPYLDRSDSQNLQRYFQDFQSIDRILYSYEYLSDIITKNTIKLARISPQDADMGYAKMYFTTHQQEEKNHEKSKILGHQYNAFGGFFKKFYRSNDLLWGRLDGLNQLVSTLLTPKSLGNFLLFTSRIHENGQNPSYLEKLVREALPKATEQERNKILSYLNNFLYDPDNYTQNHQKEFEKFVENLVKAGQREILWHDFPAVLKDLEKGEMILNPFLLG
jgi:predicted acylesterase/phospholipase RssA